MKCLFRPVILLAALGIPHSLCAEPILEAVEILLAAAPFAEQQQILIVHGPAQLSLDSTGMQFGPGGLPALEYNSQSMVEALGETKPEIIATAHASGTWVGGGANDLVISEGYIYATYQATVRQIAPLPSGFQPSAVGVLIHFQAGVDGGGYASASLRSAGGPRDYFNRITTIGGSSGPTSFDDTRPSAIGLDSYIQIELEVLAQARDYEREEIPDTLFSQALASVEIRFNQAAFNEVFGADSLPMDEYYELIYSPGTFAPEPGSVGMLLVGIAMAGGRRRR